MPILNRLKEYFGKDNVLNICTFKTEGTKSSILTSCRGIGINSDDAQFLASLVPMERGKLWTLKDCFEGNEEKERKPIKEFINEVERLSNEYNVNLKEMLFMLEGLICGRSIHASGVYIFKNGYLAQNARMKAPNGVDTTCWTMEDSDYCGGLKFDALTTEAQDKLEVAVDYLLEYGLIEWQGSIRETYNKYLHPDVLDYTNKKMWDDCNNGKIIDLFQFDTMVGKQAINKIKPQDLLQMATANSVMRLSSSQSIQPMDKYALYKNDISLWYKEMEEYNLTDEEIKVLEKYLLPLFGVADTQEVIMRLSMDENIANFTLTEANKLRKAVAKKKEKLVKEIKEKYFHKGKEAGNSDNILNYVWDQCISIQLGYSFSLNHTMPYSAIALQEMNIYDRYNHLFWDCSCLTVNAGAVDDTDDEDDDDELEEENEETTKAKKITNYGKIGKAIGDLRKHGVIVSPPYINKAKFSFTPDIENDRIIYSLKSMNGIGDDVATEIVNNAPYKDMTDFKTRMLDTNIISKGNMISLIKAGCFDEMFDDREKLMKSYVASISEPKNSLNGQNIGYIITNKLFPKELNIYARYYKFKDYIFDKKFFYKDDENTRNNKKPKKWYRLNEISQKFFEEHFIDECTQNKQYAFNENGEIIVLKEEFEKVFKIKVEPILQWIKTKEAVDIFNKSKFDTIWNKYCQGTLSKWEMDTLCYYYHEHELANVNTEKYGYVNYFELPEEPIKVGEYTYGKVTYPMYDLSRIVGTVIDKNNTRHTVTILTKDGVVNVKLYGGAYSHYNKQISQLQPDGTKKTIEKSWFTRGNIISVVGYRLGDVFKPKKYKNSTYQHTIQKVVRIDENNDLVFQSERM